MIKYFTKGMAAATFVLVMATGVVAQEAVHRLALQISDNDPQKMTTVLNVAANVARHYSDLGEEVEIRVVAFNAGLHMLRQDTSPVLERLKSFEQSMPNVSFAACGNTLSAMSKREGIEVPMVSNAEHVPAGVVDLMTLDESGWTIVRP
jgi:intracellular sulfur oxidation DsrE/DsrF family protein